MKNKSNNNKKYYKDYKIVRMFSPVDNNIYIYVYHYKIGFSATFKNIADAMYWMDGIYDRNSYSRLY